MPRPEHTKKNTVATRFSHLVRSFEFVIILALLFFTFIGFLLVKSVINQPDYLREVVWEEQFNPSNADTNFPTSYDAYEIDMSLWRPVDRRLLGIKTSPVRQTVRRKIVRTAEQQEYLFTLHTSGLKPDFVCLTHNFEFIKDYGLEKPSGAENLSRYTARIDISEEAVETPFEIAFVIYSWNAFQGEENQNFGVYVKPESEELFFDIILPRSKRVRDLRIEHRDSLTNQKSLLDKASLSYTEVSEHRATVSFSDPASGDAYFLSWQTE